MTLYQEMPKESILSELRNRFNPEEFELIRTNLYKLLDHCQTMDQLYGRAFELLKAKKDLQAYHRTHQDNFIGI